ncbi:MAG: hypothetical protein AMXMBFR20_01350 [Planctomycetia bacterium]
MTPETILELEYVWTNDGLVDRINEIDADGVETTIDFTYDQRNRLIEEVRYGQSPSPTDYQYRYLYDAAGNRLLKEDVLSGVNTAYIYDVSDPGTYGSQGNRMVESRTYLAGTNETLEKRVYTYDKSGRVKYVVREIAGDVDPENDDNQWHRGTQLIYSTQGKIWLARSMRWQLEEVPNTVGEGTHPEATHLEFQAAMEYRYDGGRQRYMVRPYHVTGASLDQGKWSDYAGQSIHGDYTVALDQSNAAVVTEKVAHEPGVIDYDYSAAAGSRQTYLHGNLIGTTEATSGASAGSPLSAGRAVYTAFGERVYANGVGGGRYGYAGAWGYQAAGTEQCGPVGETFSCDPLEELGWLHVGERYYDPACGRFVQRDPIGIAGGWNVYAYVGNEPVKWMDPTGLDRWIDWHLWHPTVTVGSDRIGYYQISFAPNDGSEGTFEEVLRAIGSWIWGVDGVSTILCIGRPHRPADRTTNDIDDLDTLKRAANRNWYHAIFDNCISAGFQDLGSDRPTGPFRDNIH